MDASTGLLWEEGVLWAAGVLCDACGLVVGSDGRPAPADPEGSSTAIAGFQLTSGVTETAAAARGGASVVGAQCFRPAELAFFEHLGVTSGFSRRVRETGAANAGRCLERVITLYSPALLATARHVMSHACGTCGRRACGARRDHCNGVVGALEENLDAGGGDAVRATLAAARRVIWAPAPPPEQQLAAHEGGAGDW